MLSSERKEQIRKRAEILSKADGYQLLLVKAYQDGIIAGQTMERERRDKNMVVNQ